jgi:glutathione S-transferase
VHPGRRAESSAQDNGRRPHALVSKRQKWLKSARTGFSQQELEDARGKIVYGLERMETALAAHKYLTGPTFSLADINVLSSV